MAARGNRLVPEPLRTPEFAVDGPSGGETGGEDEALPAFLAEDDEMKIFDLNPDWQLRFKSALAARVQPRGQRCILRVLVRGSETRRDFRGV